MCVKVLTPSLNKSFKFQSDWPKHNSQVYLLQSIITDLNKDKNVKLTEKNNRYVLSTKISYSSNKNLNNQKIYLDKKLNFKEIEVYDKSGTLQIKMVFNSIDLKASFNNKYFSTSENMKSAKIDEDNEYTNKKENSKSTKEESNSATEENSTTNNSSKTSTNESTSENEEETSTTDESNSESSSEQNSTTSTLDETIYPMYLPTGTYLSTEETVSKEEGERTILTFAGDTPFILVEEVAVKSDEYETIPVYGEPTILLDSIGALSNNSANFISNGIEYYISGENLTSEDIINVAESINSISVMK